MRLRIAELSAAAVGVGLMVGLHVNDSRGVAPVTSISGIAEETSRGLRPAETKAPTRRPAQPRAGSVSLPEE